MNQAITMKFFWFTYLFSSGLMNLYLCIYVFMVSCCLDSILCQDFLNIWDPFASYLDIERNSFKL